MIISAKRIIQLNEKYRLIDNLSEREKEPEGVGFDVRVGEIYSIKGSGFLGVEERNTPDATIIASFSNDKSYILKPNEFVLIKTIESVNIPSEEILIDKELKPGLIMADVYSRSTLFRSGVLLLATKTDPGYSGELTFGLKNLGGCDFNIELGARCANLVFKYVIGEANAYKGQWKGGRVFKAEREKQI
jgi:deoxycytidine triphosphate deaminase